MEVGWAAPSLSKACTTGASRNVGHKVLLGSPSSNSFTLAPAPNTPLPAPQTSCLKGNPVNDCHHCSGPCEVQSALCHCRIPAVRQREADALKVALLSNSTGPCRQAAFSQCAKCKAAG